VCLFSYYDWTVVINYLLARAVALVAGVLGWGGLGPGGAGVCGCGGWVSRSGVWVLCGVRCGGRLGLGLVGGWGVGVGGLGCLLWLPWGWVGSSSTVHDVGAFVFSE
jgi:hypothetical protein